MADERTYHGGGYGGAVRFETDTPPIGIGSIPFDGKSL